MSLIEKVIYSGILFLFSYLVVSLGLRSFDLTSSYVSHLVGGVSATLLGMGLFMYLLIVKK